MPLAALGESINIFSQFQQKPCKCPVHLQPIFRQIPWQGLRWRLHRRDGMQRRSGLMQKQPALPMRQRRRPSSQSDVRCQDFDCAFLFCSQLPAATPLGPRLSSRAWPLATNCIRIQETCAGDLAFLFMVAIAAATPARAALSFRTPPRAIASSTVPSLKLRSRVIARAAFAHKHASHSLFAPAPCLCASARAQ